MCFEVAKPGSCVLSCNHKASQPLKLLKENKMDYDDDERFIMTDEFDAETISLMAELGI